ncbi:MAG: beta-lactamase family protein [Sediminibacterium sp.]|nr:beta-lactamase family protein [Sediminibacterium sp.]
MFYKKILVITGLLFSSIIHAQLSNDTLEILHKIMSSYTDNIPGAQVSITRNNKIIFESAKGLANLEYNAPLTLQSKLEAGSVSKQFTAAAILLLSQEGKLSLQDDIRKYFPEIPDYGHTITVSHLLHHTSGLKDWGSIAEIAGWPRGTKAYSNEDVLVIIAAQKTLNNIPGDEFIYSNSNYNLQALIVKRITGLELSAFTKKYIFIPAGMTNTEWRDDYTRVVPNRATAYSKYGAIYATNMPNENAYGNGGLITTTEDLLKWNNFYTNNKLGTAPLFQQQISLVPLNNGGYNNYAVGLFIDSINGIPRISHSGATAGYRANLDYFPTLNLNIAWLSNNADGSFSGIPRQLEEVFTGKPSTKTTTAKTDVNNTKTAYRPDSATQAQYVGVYHSIEANSGVTISYKNGSLLLQIKPDLIRTISPVKKDVFEYPGMTIEFIRKKNKIEGYYISISRARRVFFKKAN